MNPESRAEIKNFKRFIAAQAPIFDSGPRALVNSEIRQAMEKPKSSVERLGGKVSVRH